MRPPESLFPLTALPACTHRSVASNRAGIHVALGHIVKELQCFLPLAALLAGTDRRIESNIVGFYLQDDSTILTEVYSEKSQKEGQEDHRYVKELEGSPLAVLRSPGRSGLHSGSKEAITSKARSPGGEVRAPSLVPQRTLKGPLNSPLKAPSKIHPP